MAGYPTLTYPDLLENSTREELEQILSLLQGYLSTEHKDDGTHKDVTADSIAVAGAATFAEDVAVTGDVTAANVTASNTVTTAHLTVSGRLRVTGVDDESIPAGDVLYGAGTLPDVGVVRVTSHNNDLTGIVPGSAVDDRLFLVFNDSTDLKVHHESAVPASAIHRLWLPDGKSHSLQQYEGMLVWRDTANSRFRVIGPSHEIGSFTPVLNFGGATTGITYGTQSGTFARVGQIVQAEIRIVLTAKGSATGTATITGLPYAAINNCVGDMDAAANFSGLTGAPFAVLGSAGTTLTLVQTSATGRGVVADTEFTNTSDLRISITYRT